MKMAQANRKKDMSLIAEKEYFRRIVYAHEKLEMGLESVYQCTGILILHFLSTTQTPVHQGFAQVFRKTGRFSWGPINIPSSWLQGLHVSRLFLIFSFAWSFKTFLKANIKALSIGREHFPIQSMLVATAYCICGFTARLLSYLMYFAAPLGLFSLLRHLQGEMIPMNAGFVYNFVGQNISNAIEFGNVSLSSWQLLDRWKKNYTFNPFIFGTDDNNTLGYASWNPNYLTAPPDYDIYTGLRLRWLTLILVFINCVQVVVTFVSKWKLSSYFKKLTRIEMVVHCFENIHLAYNVREWDDDMGDAQDHYNRMEANWKEGLVGIWINAFFNMVLLFPLCILGKISERFWF